MSSPSNKLAIQLRNTHKVEEIFNKNQQQEVYNKYFKGNYLVLFNFCYI